MKTRPLYLAAGGLSVAALMLAFRGPQAGSPSFAAPASTGFKETVAEREFSARQRNANPEQVRSEVWSLIGPRDVHSRDHLPEANGRLESLQNFDGSLSSAEIEEVCWFLENVTLVAEMDEAYAAEFKNELMNRLGSQPEGAQRFGTCLLRILDNNRQPEVMRDYALQHLGVWFEGFPENQRMEIIQAFWRHARSGSGSIGGTAFLNLQRLIGTGNVPLEESRNLAQLARILAPDPAAAEATRMAALNLLREVDQPAALELARRIIPEGSLPSLLTVAVATIGDCGSAADAVWLQQWAHDQAPRLRPTLERSLAKLNEKHP